MQPVKSSRGVDCHAHIFSASAPPVKGARYRPAYAARLEAWRAHWKDCGISHGVVVQPSFFGTDNSEVLAAVAHDPASLCGVAVVDPSVSDAELDRLAAGGVRGVRLNLRGVADYSQLAAPPWKALYARSAARGMHVEVFVEAGRLPEIEPAFDEADTAVVFDHFGNPGLEESAFEATFAAVARLALRRPVACKLSAPYRIGGVNRARAAARWIEAAGAASLVWGSDWPWTGHEERSDYHRLRQDLDRWVGAALAPAVVWDNAARLYGFT